MKAAVDRAPAELRLALIKAHPDLANKTQRAAGLTAESNAEQNSVGLDRLSDAEYEAFERVNNAYRAKFGFPYIVCVRRHTKDSILRDFERRLPNDAATEIADIGRGNLPDRGAACSINWWRRTTGCRCMGGCRPMCWIPTAASRRRESRSNWSNCPISARAASSRGRCTNSDGRTDQPLIGGRPVPIGRYELTLQRRGIFCRAKGADVGSAVPRPDSAAVFGERARRPSPRAAAGHALELRDLSGELRVLVPRMVSSA